MHRVFSCDCRSWNAVFTIVQPHLPDNVIQQLRHTIPPSSSRRGVPVRRSDVKVVACGALFDRANLRVRHTHSVNWVSAEPVKAYGP